MEMIQLGSTGLKVTTAGLGTGGHSKAGYYKYGPAHAANIVRTAYENGVNFFDSATAYGTESAIGNGLDGIVRDHYVLSTKFFYMNKDGSFRTADNLMADLEASLRTLRTDYIDVYHIHGVMPQDYDHVRDVFVPALQKARQQGKIRYTGITERFREDPAHQMLKKVLSEVLFDVVMVGYNLLNPSAVKTVLPLTQKNGVGTLCMFAVREAMSKPEALRKNIAHIIECGQAGGNITPHEDLSFLVQEGGAETIMEAAYRFCRHTPGIDVVLTGTGGAGHLKENLRSLEKPPLPQGILEKLEAMFGGVDCVSGE